MRLLCLLLALLLGPAAAAQTWAVPHADTTAGNGYGQAVAFDGARAVVGASGEALCGPNAGAAYVYERDSTGTGLVEAARLAPPECRPGLFFGQDVALSGDHALVTASRPFLGEEQPGAAFVFTRGPEGWAYAGDLAPVTRYRDGEFGAAVAIQGDRAVVTSGGDPGGRAYGGAAYVFGRDSSGTWALEQRLLPTAGTDAGIFGGDVALDGDRIAVSAPSYDVDRTGSVYVFDRGTDGLWSASHRVRDVQGVFVNVALDGDRLLVGEAAAGGRAGVAALYERGPEGTWAEAARLEPTTPYALGAFGAEVSLDGDRALVTGYDEQIGLEFNIDRVVYVFVRQPDGSWRQRGVLDQGRTGFGAAVAHRDDWAVVGETDDRFPGAAYLVRLPPLSIPLGGTVVGEGGE